MSETTAAASIAGEKLLHYVEQIEAINARIAGLGDDRKAVFARAVADGFIAKAIRFLIKKRKMTPSDRDEAEQIQDTYMHAVGMRKETDFARAVGLIAIDITQREQVIEALKAFTPANGSIVVEIAGTAVRLERGPDGAVAVFDAVAHDFSERIEALQREATEQDATEDEAEEMGRAAYRANKSITENPFPFDPDRRDERRRRWDKGWRGE